MQTDHLLEKYETLLNTADLAFEQIKSQYEGCVTCEIKCADCCHAIFGLFIIEAIYLHRTFEQLPEPEKEQILTRAKAADEQMEALNQKMEALADNPEAQVILMSKERIRCPFLDDNDQCMVYEHRPHTCRVYGIPTVSGGQVHHCEKAEFDSDVNYPVYNMTGAHKKMFQVSTELMEEAGFEESDKASLLISVAKAVQTSIEDLINKDF